METKNEILASVTRYIDRYGWSWNLARRLINRRFGTDLTEKELKRLYREAALFPKTNPIPEKATRKSE